MRGIVAQGEEMAKKEKRRRYLFPRSVEKKGPARLEVMNNRRKQGAADWGEEGQTWYFSPVRGPVKEVYGAGVV